MHISWYNTGIPRLWTDFAKTSLYSFLHCAADHPTKTTTVGSHFARPQSQIFKNSLHYISQIANRVCTTMNSVVNNKENLI